MVVLLELGVVASSIMGGTVRVVVGRGVVEVEIAVMEEGSKFCRFVAKSEDEKVICRSRWSLGEMGGRAVAIVVSLSLLLVVVVLDETSCFVAAKTGSNLDTKEESVEGGVMKRGG